MPDSAPKRPIDHPRDSQASSEAADAAASRPVSAARDSATGSSRRRQAGSPMPSTTAPDSATGSSRRRQAVMPMPSTGDRVDVYALEADIGAGGMGAVFRALDCRLDRHVALKLLPPEQAHDSDIVQRFYQEARAAARLDHENIARVYSIGHEAGFHYIAFEYIEGQSIRQKVETDGPLTVAETVNFTLQIASALVHAAERGVVHRDIKPSNIVVTPHGRAKLVDMGLARRFERGKDDDDGLTQPGTTLGTFDYISPEQARDPRDVDIRSDLYSLGCTIYHMLTGSPPFPEGTVTQKLLQHQKEPARDVRESNPAIPADLAAIVSKLMAKDRDRRYQTPELLMRDLLTLAGSLGLRSVSPEGLVWMSAAPRPSWERHLVWGLPTAALATVILWLVWWNQEIEPGNLSIIEPIVVAPNPKGTGENLTPPLNMVPLNGGNEATPTPAAPRLSGRDAAGERVVKAGEDLDRIIAAAPSGTILTLADEGPFSLRAVTVEPSTKAPPRDLVIRAAPGAHPVLRMAVGRNHFDAKTRYALIHFRGGRLTLEGLEIIVPAPGEPAEIVGLQADESDLTIRRCLFRRQSDESSPARGFAIRLQNRRSIDDRPPPVVVQDSHFDRELVAVQARGPADVQFHQCTFGPGNPTFWFENELDLAPLPARLGLSRVSILAGDAPIVRAIHSSLTVRVEDSIFAPPVDSTATLVETDMPDRLEWVGRSDVYARIKTYLQPILGGSSSLSIDQFNRWVDDSRTLREQDSRLTEGEVWAHTDPVRMLAGRNPSAAFQLNSGLSPSPTPGATRGPLGPIPRSSEFLGALRPQVANPQPVIPKPLPTSTVPIDAQPMPIVPMPMPTKIDDEQPPGPMERPMIAEESPDPPTPPTTPIPAEIATPSPSPPARSADVSRDPLPQRPAQAAERSLLVRTSAEFRAAITHPNPSGTTTISLAPHAELFLPTMRLSGKHHWKILGARGDDGARPILHFTPDLLGDAIGPIASSMFELNHAVLEVRGVDFVIRDEDLPAIDRSSVFRLAQDSRLRLNHCSVTVIGETVDASIFTTFSGRAPGRAPLDVDRPHLPTITAEDCLFRGEGDLIQLSGTPALGARLTNSLVALSGSLLHTYGMLLAGSPAPTIELELDRLHVRTPRGMIHLESDGTHPSLPFVKVDVNDSILSTGATDRPLIRIDGQENLDALANQLDWRGRNVLYADVDVYRRDQSSLPGSIPQRFDRVSWDLAVGMGDTDSAHGPARLVRPIDPSEPFWDLLPSDFRLISTDEISEQRGPRLDRIATPDQDTPEAN